MLHVKVTGPALQEYHNEHARKVAEFGITQKIDVQRLRRNRKIISNVPVQKTNICFDVDALSFSDNHDSCLNSTSSLGDEGEE